MAENQQRKSWLNQAFQVVFYGSAITVRLEKRKNLKLDELIIADGDRWQVDYEFIRCQQRSVSVRNRGFCPNALTSTCRSHRSLHISSCPFYHFTWDLSFLVAQRRTRFGLKYYRSGEIIWMSPWTSRKLLQRWCSAPNIHLIHILYIISKYYIYLLHLHSVCLQQLPSSRCATRIRDLETIGPAANWMNVCLNCVNGKSPRSSILSLCFGNAVLFQRNLHTVYIDLPAV